LFAVIGTILFQIGFFEKNKPVKVPVEVQSMKNFTIPVAPSEEDRAAAEVIPEEKKTEPDPENLEQEQPEPGAEQ
ncbi:MAG: hypothetical protein ILO68_02040, partial [Clostridia bacterium]|nr:hypothetical protein [Clostridia bacterium]